MNNNLYQLANIKKDSDSDSDDYDKETFTDDNVYFVEFKQNVKNWLMLDDDIIKLQAAIKERKLKKNELTPKILNFMDNNKINDLNTNDGKLKFTKSLCTKPLNKPFLISRLGDFFKDFAKGEKAATFILENRDKEEKVKLTRVKPKKEFTI